jgi:hypothetical protein
MMKINEQQSKIWSYATNATWQRVIIGLVVMDVRGGGTMIVWRGKCHSVNNFTLLKCKICSKKSVIVGN